MKTVFFAIMLTLFLSSCSEKEKDPLVISVDPWIGSAPFYYAHAKGWLREANIELILAPSIGENLRIYESGASDMFTGTQHEYFRVRKMHSDLIPVIHYDRSYGGDIVMANRTNDELINSDSAIDLYFEADTVNEEMVDYWIEDKNISKDRLRIHTRVQDEIVKITSDTATSPKVLVTYNPHNILLEKNGFQEIASTKNDNYLVVDALYTSSKLYHENQETFKQLSDIIKRSIKAYEANPKEFYGHVKPYFGNPSFEQFVVMRQNLQWFDVPPPEKLTRRLEASGFPTKEIIR